MNYKLFLVFGFFQLVQLSAVATNYSVGDTLNVMSTNGLNVRSGPSIQSEKIYKVEYRSKVVVLDNFDWRYKQIISQLNGNWIKISSNGQEGYIFDSYLSRLMPPELEPSPICGYDDFSYLLKHYAQNQIGLDGDKIETNHPKSWKVQLSNSSDTLLYHQHYEGGSNEIVFVNIRIEEAHALLRALVDLNFDCNEYAEEFSKDLLRNFRFHRKNGGVVKIDHGVREFPLANGSYFKIYKMEDGRISLTMSFPCC